MVKWISVWLWGREFEPSAGKQFYFLIIFVLKTENSHLDNAYRKAAGVKLKFDFPFYGHRLQNLTIATGGFLYVGDQTHSWLAATQLVSSLIKFLS